MFQSIKNDLQRMKDPINQLTTQFPKTCDPFDTILEFVIIYCVSASVLIAYLYQHMTLK